MKLDSEIYRKQRCSENEKTFNLLLGVFIGTLLISNVIESKFFRFNNISLTCSVITYPITFLVINIIIDRHGIGKAKKAIWAGVFSSILAVLLIELAVIMPIHKNSPISQSNLINTFKFNLSVTLSSILSFIVSQFLNIIIFQKVKNLTKKKRLWIRYSISIIMSHFVYTILFKLIVWMCKIYDNSFYFNLNPMLIIYEYMIKCFFSIVSICAIYVFIGFSKKNKNI